MSYTIIATIQTGRTQSEVMAALQTAYDNGPAGGFDTSAVPGGFVVAFARELDEDATYLTEKLGADATAQLFAKAAIDQLIAELDEVNIPYKNEAEAARNDQTLSFIASVTMQMKTNACLLFAGYTFNRFREAYPAPQSHSSGEPVNREISEAEVFASPTLMLIDATSCDGDSLNLFVRATTRAAALRYWKTYYANHETDTPPRVFLAPPGDGPPCAISWNVVRVLEDTTSPANSAH